MPVYKNLKAVRKLTNSSLTSIIDITNLNFTNLSNGILELLSNIQYDETLNTISLYASTFDFVDITDTLSLKLDGIPTFTIDSLGRAEGQELLVKVAETKRLRLTDFNDWPDVGVPGEIIYTGIQNQKVEFGEDFIGYLQGRGWVSLTGLGQNFVTLNELIGSPPVPPIVGPGSGSLWIGAPGFETDYESATQTVYYTDENGKIFDILSDFVWTKDGDDAIFKLDGKVTIGDLTTPKAFQYVDGNQTAGYVLTCDASGNASWQPTNTGGATACSFVILENFTANVSNTITHSLVSTSLIIQLIKVDTNEKIDGYFDNYQSNSVDITLTETLTNIKVIILAGDCAGGGGGGGSGLLGHKKYIGPAETLTLLEDYQYWIYGTLTVEGTFDNYGQIVIANGTLNILPGGLVNNLGLGYITLLNLATGDGVRVDIQNFTTTAGVPIIITHNLNTKEFVYNVREGNNMLDVDLLHIDDDNVQLTTTSSVPAGVITFHAKITI